MRARRLAGALARPTASGHPKAERPGTVVLPQDERVFNPSRETRLILRQAGQIGEHAARLCQLGSPRFQCNNWRYANPALARGWCW